MSYELMKIALIKNELMKTFSKKKQNLDYAQKQVNELALQLKGLEEALAAFQHVDIRTTLIPREGSELHKVYTMLKEVGTPLHIEQILKWLGKENSEEARLSLTASLARYAKEERIFTRTAPNTFGLIEFYKNEDKNQLYFSSLDLDNTRKESEALCV